MRGCEMRAYWPRICRARTARSVRFHAWSSCLLCPRNGDERFVPDIGARHRGASIAAQLRLGRHAHRELGEYLLVHPAQQVAIAVRESQIADVRQTARAPL